MAITLSGTLRDPYGNPIPKAHIEFRAEKTNALVVATSTSVAVTDEHGQYITLVNPGSYAVRIKFSNSNSWTLLGRHVAIRDDMVSTSLNDVLVNAKEEAELTPQVILTFQSIKAEAASSAQKAQEYAAVTSRDSVVAKQAATEAKGSSETAAGLASDAKASAATATSAADAAKTSETTAFTHEENAKQYAADARENKNNAQAASDHASQMASDTKVNADAADVSAKAAKSAEAGAESHLKTAEGYKDSAEASSSSAASSQQSAASSAAKAKESESVATTAKDTAVQSASDAKASADNAADSRKFAEQAKSSAETSAQEAAKSSQGIKDSEKVATDAAAAAGISKEEAAKHSAAADKARSDASNFATVAKGYKDQVKDIETRVDNAQAAVRNNAATVQQNTNTVQASVDKLGDSVDKAVSAADIATKAASGMQDIQKSASESAEEAKQWASAPQDTKVNGVAGQYSAKHWATVAEQRATGQNKYLGDWGFPDNKLPEAPTNASTWSITKAATVEGVDYAPGDTLQYYVKEDGTGGRFFKISSNAAVASVAGKKGVVTLTLSDIENTEHIRNVESYSKDEANTQFASKDEVTQRLAKLGTASGYNADSFETKGTAAKLIGEMPLAARTGRVEDTIGNFPFSRLDAVPDWIRKTHTDGNYQYIQGPDGTQFRIGENMFDFFNKAGETSFRIDDTGTLVVGKVPAWNVTGLSDVMKTGSYYDLTNRPALAEAALRPVFNTHTPETMGWDDNAVATQSTVKAVYDYAVNLHDSVAAITWTGNLNHGLGVLDVAHGGTGRGDGQLAATRMTLSGDIAGVYFGTDEKAAVYPTRNGAGAVNAMITKADTALLTLSIGGNLSLKRDNRTTFNIDANGQLTQGTVPATQVTGILPISKGGTGRADGSMYANIMQSTRYLFGDGSANNQIFGGDDNGTDMSRTGNITMNTWWSFAIRTTCNNESGKVAFMFDAREGNLHLTGELDGNVHCKHITGLGADTVGTVIVQNAYNGTVVSNGIGQGKVYSAQDIKNVFAENRGISGTWVCTSISWIGANNSHIVAFQKIAN